MAAENDLGFTFDTSFFDKGIKKVMGGFGQMEVKAATVAKGVSRGLTAVIGKLGLLFVGFKSIKTALLDMPEVGQAFGIAKDVFLKNLLFPLRKEVFPLLQKMLDWVRDSRVMFVKWGQNIANVFRAVVQGVKNIIGFIKKMSLVVAGFAEKIFGDRVKNINDLFNIIVFKVSTVIQFVSLMVEQIGGIFAGFFSGIGDIGPALMGIVKSIGDFLNIFVKANDQGDSFGGILKVIAERIGQIAGFIITMTDKFLSGFVPAISGIMTPLQKIVDAWISIGNSIFGISDSIISWGPLFQTLGEIVGKGLMFYFETIATIIDKIADVIDKITASDLMGSLKAGAGNLFESLGGVIKGAIGIDDGIIKPDGTVIKTNPNDTLVALKDQDSSLSGLLSGMTSGSNSVEKNISTSIDFSGMVVQVQNGGVEEGQEFAMGLIEQMRNEFNAEYERYGF